VDATRRAWLWIGLCCLAGIALRAAGARGELWVDEIWSVEIARRAPSLPDLLSLRHDNNHLLNSAWLHWLGPAPHAWQYRLPTLLAGIGTLAVVAWIGLERSRLEAVAAVALFAVAYPFVLYGSEARGYGQAVFFAVLAYAALRSHLRRPRAATAALFSACGVLGLLSHLSYVHVALGALLWSGWVWLRAGLRPARLAGELLRCHAAPLAAAAALYAGFVRDMQIAGGPHYSIAYALARSSALLLALPESPAWLVPGLALAVAITCAAAVWLARRRPQEAVGLVLLGALAPALVVAALRPELVYPRYFLVDLAFVLLLWSHALAGLLERGGAWRWLACAGLAAFAAGHLRDGIGLARHGRSGFGAGLERALRDPGGGASALRVGIAPDPISAAWLRFQAEAPPRARPLRGFAMDEIPVGGVDWLLLLAPDRRAPPEPSRRDRHGNHYRLLGVEPAARESGFAVLVYRRVSGGG
jgi:hypothetical protein